MRRLDQGTYATVNILGINCFSHDTAAALIQGTTTTVSDGVYTEAQARRGLEKYTQVCSNCHEPDLSGSDQSPALVGGEFLDRWEGQSVGDLADRIRTSMPQDDIGSLNIQMSADLTAYLLQFNKFPAGQKELPADRSAMKAIAIKRR